MHFASWKHSCYKNCTFLVQIMEMWLPQNTSLIDSTTIPFKRAIHVLPNLPSHVHLLCVCLCVCVCFGPFFAWVLILALKGQGNVSLTIKRFSSSTTTTRGGCWLACCIVKKRETFPYNLFPPKYQHQKKNNLIILKTPSLV